MNQFCRVNIKTRLPEKLKTLADNKPNESQWLFGDDLSKRISQINYINSLSALNLSDLISRVMVSIKTVVGTHTAVKRR